MLTYDEVYSEVETSDVLDTATLRNSNYKTLFKLEDPYKIKMCHVLKAQMVGGAKCTVTNNINLLKNFRLYNCWFRP